jgi:protein-disulfide isomerase
MKAHSHAGSAPALTLRPMPGRDHIQGPTSAPLALLEYGDFQCPYCGAAYPVVKEVQERLGERLCFAFRNFPLVNSHPNAEHAAEAAEAAGAQSAYWKMHDLLFENQRALEDEDLARYAAALDLDVRRFTSEVLEGAYVARIQEDFRSGARGGVNGTPTFFVNGVRFDGAPDVDSLVEALNTPQE